MVTPPIVLVEEVNVLLVNDSLPARVANVPLVGKVNVVFADVVKDRVLPDVDNGIIALAPKSGNVYTLLADGAVDDMVIVFVVPKTN
jgi:hypothetical protein